VKKERRERRGERRENGRREERSKTRHDTYNCKKPAKTQ
jgi:hypothetical protein